MLYPSQSIILGGIHISVPLSVHFDHLFKVLFPRFLHSKITIFPFVTDILGGLCKYLVSHQILIYLLILAYTDDSCLKQLLLWWFSTEVFLISSTFISRHSNVKAKLSFFFFFIAIVNIISILILSIFIIHTF